MALRYKLKVKRREIKEENISNKKDETFRPTE